MNKCIQTLRFTRDPEVRYGANGNAVASFGGAVDRRFARDGEDKVDFFNYVAFGKTAEFIEKYFRQGTKAVVISHPQNEEYTNKDGVKVRTIKFLVDEIEFAESKKASTEAPVQTRPSADEFMNVDDSDLDELPFN